MSKSYIYICISAFCNACGLTCGHQGYFFQFFDIQNFTKFVWEKQKKKSKVFPIFVKMKKSMIIMNLFKLWWLTIEFFLIFYLLVVVITISFCVFQIVKKKKLDLFLCNVIFNILVYVSKKIKINLMNKKLLKIVFLCQTKHNFMLF